MSVTDQLLTNNAAFTPRSATPAGPSVAVVACMDARMDVYAILGLTPGQAHVIRNAGGLVTDDAIRSLAISQRLLGTSEVVLLHHTDCGMTKFTDAEFRAQLKADTGLEPDWEPGAFTDLDADVRASIQRVHDSPFLLHKEARGFVYDVASGRLREVQ